MTGSDLSGRQKPPNDESECTKRDFDESSRIRRSVAHKLFGQQAVPPRIDRFVVLRELSCEGGERRFLAFDTGFERKVELLLCPKDVQIDDARSKADAMSKALDVHIESGAQDDKVYISIARFPNALHVPTNFDQNLNLGEQLNPWIVAGKQLCSAHRAGVIHGGFSSASILRLLNGRYVVVGFRYWHFAPQRHQSAIGLNLAPEIITGSAFDEKSDQLSYCMALWRFFCEKAETEGSQQFQLSEEGNLKPDHSHLVPKRLRPLLSRGMAMDPEMRHDSLKDVVSGLEREHKRLRRLRMFRKCLGVAFLLVSGIFARTFLPSLPTCDTHLEPWEQAEQSLADPKGVSGTSSIRNLGVIDELRTYIARGKALERAACLRHESDPSSSEAISACFAAAVDSVFRYHERVVRLLSKPKSQLASPLGALPSLDACIEKNAAPLNKGTSAAQIEVELDLAKAKLQGAFHEFTSSLQSANHALALLEHQQETPQYIRALLLRARALNALGETLAARKSVDLAYLRAEYQGDLSLRLQAAVLRSKIMLRQNQFGASVSALRDAWPLAQKPEVSVEAKFEFLSKACLVDRRDMKRCETLDFCRRAGELIEQHGLSELARTEIESRMAWIYYEAGRTKEAVDLARSAKERSRAFAPGNSSLSLAADSLYLSLLAEDLRKSNAKSAAYAAIEAESRTVLERHLQAYGSKSYLVSIARTNLAEITRRSGNLLKAKDLYEQELEIFADDPERYFALTGYGKVLLKLGHKNRAIEVLNDALVVIEEIESKSHQSGGNPQIPERPEALLALSQALGPSPEGLDAARRAITLYHKLQRDADADALTCPELQMTGRAFEQEIQIADRWLATCLAKTRETVRPDAKKRATKE